MVADWIIGMWTVTATLKIVGGCVLYMITDNKEDKSTGLSNMAVGLFMAIFSAMHYSGM